MIAECDPNMSYVIKKVLDKDEEFEVVGEAGDCMKALQLFECLAPQVVFIDIDITGKKGLNLAKLIHSINPQTCIIFATGYEFYIEEAYEVNAFDYLMKPLNLDVMKKTMQKIKSFLAAKPIVGAELQTIERLDIFKNKRIFYYENKLVYLNLKDIIFITRENRRVAIYHTNGTVTIKSRLSDMEQQLGGYPFYRSHAGFIVNLDMVKELIPTSRNSYEVIFINTDKKALMTREKVKNLIKIINYTF